MKKISPCLYFPEKLVFEKYCAIVYVIEEIFGEFYESQVFYSLLLNNYNVCNYFLFRRQGRRKH